MPIADSELRPRLLPERALPSYAYLPGRFPHPVRHPLGHSYELKSTAAPGTTLVEPNAFTWGVDLFNHGYYWEAHEAWEPLWRAADRNSDDRKGIKGLILLAAAGVKLREHKNIAAGRHGRRACALFRSAAAKIPCSTERMLGMTFDKLADFVAPSTFFDEERDLGDEMIVFPFVFGRRALEDS